MAEEEQKTIVLVTGGFDPLHSGHIAYLEEARQLGDTLIVGLNSDAWLTRKKGKAFMPVDERGAIVDALGCVDKVIGFDEEYDADDSACSFIKDMLEYNPKARIIFANGGDRKIGNILEDSITDSRLMFAQSVGGDDKKNSSSWILKDWEAPKVERDWGHYRELYKGGGFAVKELVINPHSKLTMQKHKHRSETWNLVSGTAHILTGAELPHTKQLILTPSTPVDIPAGTWHQGVNDSDEPAHIVEIWKGSSELLSEDDITRWT